MRETLDRFGRLDCLVANAGTAGKQYHRPADLIPRRSEEGFELTDVAPPSRIAVTGKIGPFHASSSYLPTADGILLTSNAEPEPSSALAAADRPA